MSPFFGIRFPVSNDRKYRQKNKKLLMASARKDRSHKHQHNLTAFQQCVPWIACAILSLIVLIPLVASIIPGAVVGLCPERTIRMPQHCLHVESEGPRGKWALGFGEIDCLKMPQAYPVVAQRMDGVKYPFMVALQNLGTPKQPHPNFVRLMTGRLFRQALVSSTLQSILEGLINERYIMPDSIMIDVGANVGTATFAAAVMGVRVLAVEPVLENAQRLCDGIYLNRAAELVKVHLGALSNVSTNATLYKVLTRLDRSSMSLAGARVASSKLPPVPVTVETHTLDSLISSQQHVALLKVAVQGWELHVLHGARQLLGRPYPEAPPLLYEDDRILLRASNVSQSSISSFLRSVGYTCETVEYWRICRKSKPEDS